MLPGVNRDRLADVIQVARAEAVGPCSDSRRVVPRLEQESVPIGPVGSGRGVDHAVTFRAQTEAVLHRVVPMAAQLAVVERPDRLRLAQLAPVPGAEADLTSGVVAE